MCIPRGVGFVTYMNGLPRIKGDALTAKYMQRQLPQGIKLDCFTANAKNWGYILAIRTGPASFSKRLVTALRKEGHAGEDGYVTWRGKAIATPEELDVFQLAKIPWVEPRLRV